MNHDIDDVPRFEDPLREHEWQQQEQAMRRERLHLDPAGDDARSGRYRLLARALRAASPDALPSDFAHQMNILASTQSRRQVPTVLLENALATVLGGVLVLAAVIVAILYGATWWPPFEALLPAPAAAQWWLALLGCVGLSWLLGAASRLARPAA